MAGTKEMVEEKGGDLSMIKIHTASKIISLEHQPLLTFFRLVCNRIRIQRKPWGLLRLHYDYFYITFACVVLSPSLSMNAHALKLWEYLLARVTIRNFSWICLEITCFSRRAEGWEEVMVTWLSQHCYFESFECLSKHVFWTLWGLKPWVHSPN